MDNVTVNISIRRSPLDRIDVAAKRESRSRSELLREAARQYVRRRKQWEDVFARNDRQAARLRLSEADVAAEIRAVRRRKSR